MASGRKYKYCFVPACRSSTITSSEKLFITVPMHEPLRSKWMKAVRRDTNGKPVSPKTKFYICEDHFDLENDIENLMYVRMFLKQEKKVRVRLKSGILPSRFECQAPLLLNGRKRRSDIGHEKLSKRMDLKGQLDVSKSNVESQPSSLPIISDEASDDHGRINARTHCDVGVHVQPERVNVGIQTKVRYKSKATQVSRKMAFGMTASLRPSSKPERSGPFLPSDDGTE